MGDELISLNITVILQKGNVLKAIKLLPQKVIVFEKLRFKPENAVGLPFGSVFEAKDGQLVPVNSASEKCYDVASGTDNRCLTDTHGKSQVLKRDDLLQMKGDGATGEEIVQSLVENSSSFSGKTVFSQKKYLKKKQRKYFSYVQIHKPTARLICIMYQEREPAKIYHMRIDSMSQILATTNIRSGSKVAVLETCSGVVLGMVLARLGGSGALVNLHVGETPANLFAVSHFNFPDSHWNILHSLPLHKLAPLLAARKFASTFHGLKSDEICNRVQPEEESSDAVSEPLFSQTTKDSKTEIASPGECSMKRKHPLSDDEKLAIRAARQQKRFKHQETAWKLLSEKNMDALIVATKYHPTPIVLSMLEVLALSKPFAVYCEYKEPLMELFVRLSTTGAAINLQLSDTFMRQYQVLPERSHPHVMMAGGGGYLLSGIKV